MDEDNESTYYPPSADDGYRSSPIEESNDEDSFVEPTTYIFQNRFVHVRVESFQVTDNIYYYKLYTRVTLDGRNWFRFPTLETSATWGEQGEPDSDDEEFQARRRRGGTVRLTAEVVYGGTDHAGPPADDVQDAPLRIDDLLGNDQSADSDGGTPTLRFAPFLRRSQRLRE